MTDEQFKALAELALMNNRLVNQLMRNQNNALMWLIEIGAKIQMPIAENVMNTQQNVDQLDVMTEAATQERQRLRILFGLPPED